MHIKALNNIVKNQLEERVASLQLAKTPRIGHVTFYKLLKAFGSATNALNNLEDYVGHAVKIFPRAKVESELEEVEAFGGGVIAGAEDAFPDYLRHLPVPVSFLEYKGDISLINDYRHNISIVGARKCSINGGTMATNIARDLSEFGLVIVSGMALGIDGCAHRGALPDRTVAVLAGGVDNIYPKEHESLYHEILDHQGLILSEAFIHSVPRAEAFPQRNRIVVATTFGTVIIEAKLNSGTIITAHLARKQGKPLFVVPGSPLNESNSGGNQLIREGGNLISNARDVIEYLQFQNGNNSLKEEGTDNYQTSKISDNACLISLPPKAEVEIVIEEILNKISFEATSLKLLEKTMLAEGVGQSSFDIAIVQLILTDKVVVEDETIAKIYSDTQRRTQ